MNGASGCATFYQPMTVFAVIASSYPVNFGGSTDSIDRYTVYLSAAHTVVKRFSKTLEHKFEAVIESQLVKHFSVLGLPPLLGLCVGVRSDAYSIHGPYSTLAIRSNLYFLTGFGRGPYSIPSFGVDISYWR